MIYVRTFFNIAATKIIPTRRINMNPFEEGAVVNNWGKIDIICLRIGRPVTKLKSLLAIPFAMGIKRPTVIPPKSDIIKDWEMISMGVDGKISRLSLEFHPVG